jgi:hypothetical protein
MAERDVGEGRDYPAVGGVLIIDVVRHDPEAHNSRSFWAHPVHARPEIVRSAVIEKAGRETGGFKA